MNGDERLTSPYVIKAIGDNYFDEYEMCCLDLPDAIDSLLKRYDNAFIKFKKIFACHRFTFYL